MDLASEASHEVDAYMVRIPQLEPLSEQTQFVRYEFYDTSLHVERIIHLHTFQRSCNIPQTKGSLTNLSYLAWAIWDLR